MTRLPPLPSQERLLRLFKFQILMLISIMLLELTLNVEVSSAAELLMGSHKILSDRLVPMDLINAISHPSPWIACWSMSEMLFNQNCSSGLVITPHTMFGLTIISKLETQPTTLQELSNLSLAILTLVYTPSRVITTPGQSTYKTSHHQTLTFQSTLSQDHGLSGLTLKHFNLSLSMVTILLPLSWRMVEPSLTPRSLVSILKPATTKTGSFWRTDTTLETKLPGSKMNLPP